MFLTPPTETIINHNLTRIFCLLLIDNFLTLIEYLETESRIGYSVSGTQAHTNYGPLHDKGSQYAMSHFGTQMAGIDSPGALCSVMDIDGEIGCGEGLGQDCPTALPGSHGGHDEDLQIDHKR